MINPITKYIIMAMTTEKIQSSIDINAFIRENHNKMYLIEIAKALHISKRLLSIRINNLHLSHKVPMEVQYDGKFVFIPEINAHVKIRKDSSVEKYLANLAESKKSY